MYRASAASASPRHAFTLPPSRRGSDRRASLQNAFFLAIVAVDAAEIELSEGGTVNFQKLLSRVIELPDNSSIGCEHASNRVVKVLTISNRSIRLKQAFLHSATRS